METINTDIVVLGAGPGGYAAAFYAADLGKKVILVEPDTRLGGVCLNRGCIPSKALLHATEVLSEAQDSSKRGISFGEPKVDLEQLRNWKETLLQKLGSGIELLAKKRNVQVIQGKGQFENSSQLTVQTSEGPKKIAFDKAIIAVGSLPTFPKAFDIGSPRVMTSTEALALEEIPQSLLIIGAGYIGMELGTVYAKLGSKVTLVEALPALLGTADQDLVRPVIRFAEARFQEIHLGTKITKLETVKDQIRVTMEKEGQTLEKLVDRVLISVGRIPNSRGLNLEKTKAVLDEKGFIKVNENQQTDDPNIYAIGDIAGGALLAHKASKEGRVAIDSIMGNPTSIQDAIIPAVVFTDPEIAWCGLTEADARAQNISMQVARFPWAASGRAMTFDRPDGLTKLIIDPTTEKILGAGIVGHGAGELISECVVAIEMGATAKDLAETVHPHPTLSETIMECAEVFYGHPTHTLPIRKRQPSPA
jgi:dihydrolipoamide dehydrogenase